MYRLDRKILEIQYINCFFFVFFCLGGVEWEWDVSVVTWTPPPGSPRLSSSINRFYMDFIILFYQSI